jgi:hypothetical protein
MREASSVSRVYVFPEVLANGHGLDVQNVKRNKKECEHVAKRSAKLVQDIWTQTRDFGVALPVEVEKSVVEIERYVPAPPTYSARN